MLSKDTEFRLDHAVTDEKIGEEIAARVEVSSTPADKAAAQAILNVLDESKSDSIDERMKVALAGDGSKGEEIAKKVNGMVEVLKAKANGSENATVLLTVDAFAPGQLDGATVTVNGQTVTEGVEWTADPGQDVFATAASLALAIQALTDVTALDIFNDITIEAIDSLAGSAGNGTAISTSDASLILSNATLEGGSDGTGDVPAAKAAMGSEPMSEEARFHLEHALTSKKAADEFKESYDAMVAAIQAIS